MNALVSIIIPAYNAEKYILDTVNSAINQTYTAIEIIIVDDGSTDNTPAIIKSINSNKIKIITQKNSGASFAKQVGLNHANGEFIQYLDADDLLSPNKIEEQVYLLKNKPNHIAICSTIHFINGTDKNIYPKTSEWYDEDFNDPADFLIKLYGGSYIGPKYGGMIQPNAFLTPISVIKKAGNWDATISPCPDEDGEYFCRIILASQGIVYAKNAVNFYRKFLNKSSLSALRSYQACANILKSTQLKAAHLLAATADPRAKLALSSQLWHDAFSFYPAHKTLALTAVQLAKTLYPTLKINPYTNLIKNKLCLLFGWKFVSYLDYYRQYFNSKKTVPNG